MTDPRVIVTKHRVYQLPDDAQGVPLEEYWPDIKMTEWLKGAKVYQTEDGPVIAVPDRPEKPRAAKPKGVDFP
jgi:hypothetical protein